ncbi:MAG: hypothetical protein LQ342_003053 [Letrouitia transgressa]|nr:MAG: hypothetical protein LQ342_003053 [Letrouitia transgressa]
MKEALKTKDKIRLNVLRSILTETTALEKRSRPVTTDKQVYNVIEKQIRASTKAAEEFALASRSDLQDKENAQIQIMEEFRDEVETVPPEEAVEAVKSAIEKLQADGVTPKRERVRRLLFGPGGTFEDKVVNDRHGEMAKTINSLVHEVAPSKPDNPRKTVTEGQSG